MTYHGTGMHCVGDTSAAGAYPAGASPYGALDMAGNVWEWVNDWYAADYYGVSPPSDPQGPGTGSGLKVGRSGSWDYCSVVRPHGVPAREIPPPQCPMMSGSVVSAPIRRPLR